ncbi:MAG: hypothetical protein AAF561_00590 [Planctomycetota bacterium]
MRRLFVLFLIAALPASELNAQTDRPHDPWVFRCVLDGRARTVVVALSDDIWAAWDAQTCDLYKIWQGGNSGGMKFTGTVYDTRHGPQPRTRGEVLDTFEQSSWTLLRDDVAVPATVRWLGHRVDGTERVVLRVALQTESGEVITIEETPASAGPRSLERTFEVTGLPDGIRLRNKLANGEDATVQSEGGLVIDIRQPRRVLLFEIASDGAARATVTW